MRCPTESSPVLVRCLSLLVYLSRRALRIVDVIWISPGRTSSTIPSHMFICPLVVSDQVNVVIEAALTDQVVMTDAFTGKEEEACLGIYKSAHGQS